MTLYIIFILCMIVSCMIYSMMGIITTVRVEEYSACDHEYPVPSCCVLRI